MLHSICNNIKILIIGGGSIGNKHYSYLKSLGCIVKILSRRSGIGDFSDLDQALPNNFDLIIVATETSTHAKIIKEIQKKNLKARFSLRNLLLLNWKI
jgi:predicted dehydrogenase